jgi:hypothetical protein
LPKFEDSSHPSSRGWHLRNRPEFLERRDAESDE